VFCVVSVIGDVRTIIIIIIIQVGCFIFYFTMIKVDCFNNVFMCFFTLLLYCKLTFYNGIKHKQWYFHEQAVCQLHKYSNCAYA